MPIKLRNRGRLPITLEVPALGNQKVPIVRNTPQGREETARSFPLSLFIPGREESGVLPDAVAQDPAVVAQLHPRGPLQVVAASAPSAPAQPAAPAPAEESAPAEAPNNPDGVTPPQEH